MVSVPTPVEVNGWKISLSSQEVSYPDGARHYELRARNGATGEQVSAPLVTNAEIRLGQASLKIGGAWPMTRSAQLYVSRHPDRSIRGRHAYVHRWSMGGTYISNENAMTRLSEQYGFDVVWAATPDVVTALKRENYSAGENNTTVEALVAKTFPKLVATWVDDTHLSVSPTAEFMAAWQSEQKVVLSNQAVVSRFKQDYVPATKVYRLRQMDARAAAELLRPELSTYFVTNRTTPYKIEVVSATDLSGYNPKYVAAKVVEEIVPDPRANALYVRATTPTQARIADGLRQLEVMIAPEDATAAAPRRFPLEVVFLRGSAGRFPASVAQVLRQSSGQVQNACTAQVESVEPVARLSPADMLDRIRVLSFVHSGTDVRAVLAQLAASYNIPIVVSSKLQGCVYANLKDVSLRQLLDAILPPIDGTYIVQPHMIHVLRRDDLQLNAQDSQRYGISQSDLRRFGITQLEELGRARVDLLAVHGSVGEATVSLTDQYSARITFMDLPEPYLVVKGALIETGRARPLLENTLYLRPNQPNTLGLTNLREALILVIRRLPEAQ